MTNINDHVSVKKNGEATFKCTHYGDFLTKMPFKIYIKKYLPDSFDEETAKIFFLLNLKIFSKLDEIGESN